MWCSSRGRGRCNALSSCREHRGAHSFRCSCGPGMGFRRQICSLAALSVSMGSAHRRSCCRRLGRQHLKRCYQAENLISPAGPACNQEWLGQLQHMLAQMPSHPAFVLVEIPALQTGTKPLAADLLGIIGQVLVSTHLLAICNVKALSVCLGWLSIMLVPDDQSLVNDYEGLAAMQQLPCYIL